MRYLLLVILVCSTTTFSQKYYNWEVIPAPGKIAQAAYVSEDEFFIHTTGQGYFYTTDRGSNWNMCEGDLPQNPRFIQKIGERIFLSEIPSSLEAVLFFTDDLGQTVNKVIFPPTYFLVDIMASDSAIYLQCRLTNSILRSTDGGSNWESYQLPSYPSDLEVTKDDNLFYCGFEGVFKLDKSSGEWELLDNRNYISMIANGDTIAAYIEYPENDLSYTLNGGANWFQFRCHNSIRSLDKKAPNEFFATIYGNKAFNLFRIDLASGETEQILSKSNDAPLQFEFIGDKIYYADFDSIYIQGEEIFPEFKSGFYPLNKKNRWFYFTSTKKIDDPKEFTNVHEISIVKDSLISGKKFHLLNNGKWMRYKNEENKILEFTHDEIIENISFNFGNGYMYRLYEEPLFYYLIPLIPITGTGLFSGLDGYRTREYSKFLYITSTREYIRDVGLVHEVSVNHAYNNNTSMLKQAIIFDETGDSTLYDMIEDPVIGNDLEHEWLEQSIKINCGISHVLNNYIVFSTHYKDSLNFIDEAILDYRYISDNIPGEVTSVEIACDTIIDRRAVYSWEIPIDTVKLNEDGEKFSFRISAKTRGIIPHHVETEWQDVEYIPTSLNMSDMTLDYSLSANYPNPFNPSTSMEFTLPKTSLVEISVYNVTGEKLFTVANESYSSGRHQCTINMADYSTGVYFVHMISNEKRFVRKILLLK